MKTKIITLVVLAVLGATSVTQIINFPRMRFTVHIIGEDGQPISGVNATFMFNEAAGGFGKLAPVNVVTDSNGNFTVEGYSENGVIGTTSHELNKEGYYNGGVNAGHNFFTSKDGEWQPWDQTYTTVLRKVGTPIPLYARKLAIEVPGSINEPCGFDLEEADWVAPYGKGKVADLIVTVTKAQFRNYNDYEGSATVTFSNPDDGLVEIQLPKEFANSKFKWPREAPEGGYQPNLEAHSLWFNMGGSTQRVNTANENQAYFFRVRTMKQGEQIISALYGKISGGISIGPDKTLHGFIQFTYYLNPTPLDLNLEWDPTKNLAPTPDDLSQRVREP